MSPVWVHLVAGMATPPASISLYSMQAGDASNVWVTGDINNHGAARRWDGASWITHDNLSVGPYQTHYADASADVWASTRGQTQVVRAWDGSAWNTETPLSSYFAGTPTALNAYQYHDASNAADLTWYSWNGSTWGSEQVASPTNATYTNLTIGSTSGNLGIAHMAAERPDGAQYVLGVGVDTTLYAVVLRNTGGTIDEVRRLAGLSFSHHAIWAPTNSDIYHLTGGTSGVQLAHSDGTGTPELWFTVTLPTGGWWDLHGVATNDWWLLSASAAAQWDGSTYTTYTLPVPWASPFLVLATSIWAVASNDVWACGYGQQTSTSPPAGIVWHWAGSAWTVHTVFTS